LRDTGLGTLPRRPRQVGKIPQQGTPNFEYASFQAVGNRRERRLKGGAAPAHFDGHRTFKVGGRVGVTGISGTGLRQWDRWFACRKKCRD